MAIENQLNLQEFQEYFVYLEFTESTGDVINFLDLNISYDCVTNKLKFSEFSLIKFNRNILHHMSSIPFCFYSLFFIPFYYFSFYSLSNLFSFFIPQVIYSF